MGSLNNKLASGTQESKVTLDTTTMQMHSVYAELQNRGITFAWVYRVPSAIEADDPQLARALEELLAKPMCC